jgi:hypothetical protein
MDTTQELEQKRSGQRLVNAERTLLISKMLDLLCNGYISTNALAKQLKVSRDTVATYRPVVDDLIGKQKFDRNIIRNLQLQRTYNILEQLMIDLKAAKEVDDRAKIYGSIYKFSSHLALITGLNVETHVTVDPTKLVIIRANRAGKSAAESEVIDQ